MGPRQIQAPKSQRILLLRAGGLDVPRRPRCELVSPPFLLMLLVYIPTQYPGVRGKKEKKTHLLRRWRRPSLTR
jgi:hypothetical protein